METEDRKAKEVNVFHTDTNSDSIEFSVNGRGKVSFSIKVYSNFKDPEKLKEVMNIVDEWVALKLEEKRVIESD